MTATFIVSLDCEGKWGMADNLQPYHHAALTDAALAAAYDRLLALFARYEISATFAYVMAFTLSRSERLDFADVLEPREGAEDPWLRYYWADRAAGRIEGWFQPHALEAVMADGRHEIACHSFCHRPMGDHSLSDAEARAELSAAARAAKVKGIRPRTFIFPRNEVGNLAALADAGYMGFRESLARSAGRRGRLARLAEEFNVRSALQHGVPPAPGELIRIPAGYFLNWRFGLRKYVPAAMTVARWRSLIDRTAAQGGVVHLWLHPHNLITAPSTGATLETVLEHAAALRDRGALRISTQEHYCRKVLAES